MNIDIVGRGRAGGSFARALRRAGHDVAVVGRDDRPRSRTALILMATPDDTIAAVAAALAPSPAVVAHVSGATGLDALAPHDRVGSLHPLAVLPDAERGAERLVGATYVVEGDDLLDDVARSLSGMVVRIAPEQRALYHATAVTASNHVVALLAEIEALASSLGLAASTFSPLIEQTLADVRSLGIARALTGPAARGDHRTIDAHRKALPSVHEATYSALSAVAARVAGGSMWNS